MFDFTNDDNTDSMMPNLVRELGSKGRYKIQDVNEGLFTLTVCYFSVMFSPSRAFFAEAQLYLSA